MNSSRTIPYVPLSDKHISYISNAFRNRVNVAEGAIRSGKTIDNCIIAAVYLEKCRDKLHLASGSTIGNAKLNIGSCNGFGLENLFRGRCRWGKYKGNEALVINTQTGEKIVIFAGGSKSNSYQSILGNSYGLWIATEINEHYDSEDSQTSFIKVAMGRQIAALDPLTLWDLNPCNPRHPIYKRYIDKWLSGIKGGYQYKNFTLDDNSSISQERREEIKSRYDINTVWYRRDILGQRCTADGLIYQTFANHNERYLIHKNEVPPLHTIYIGTDFGGNKSSHAITASGWEADRRTIYVLKSSKISAKGTTPDDVMKEIVTFSDIISREYRGCDMIFCDHMNVFVNAINQNTAYRADYCYKPEIKERIFLENMLFKQERIKLVEGQCDDLIMGLNGAVYDRKSAEQGIDCRADTDSTENDCIDSFEYSWTSEIDYFEL